MKLVTFVGFEAIFKVEEKVATPFDFDKIIVAEFSVLLNPVFEAFHHLQSVILLPEQLFVQTEQEHPIVAVVIGFFVRFGGEVSQLLNYSVKFYSLFEVLHRYVIFPNQVHKFFH